MKTMAGYYIREYRKRTGTNQQALAEMIGVKQPVISDYEAGNLTPRIPVARKICKIIGVSLDTLLSNPVDSEPSSCQN